MSSAKKYSVAESNAFINECEIGPWRSGKLNGLRFAVSEMIDVAERPTGCGNPSWSAARKAAACNALCVDMLLSAGAQCVGRTRTDEFTFSLVGESSFFSTPLNPRAPERVPGGSSSGAASAVACGIVDFAISLDSGAATQVTSSNCGLYGWRPVSGTIPTAGIQPVSPSFDTVGIVAASPAVLKLVAEVFANLGGAEELVRSGQLEIYKLSDAWRKADTQVLEALQGGREKLEELLGISISAISLEDIGTIGSGGSRIPPRKPALPGRDPALSGGNPSLPAGNVSLPGGEASLSGNSAVADLHEWYQTYLKLFCMESWNSFGTWIESSKPELGQEAKANIHRSRLSDRSDSLMYFQRRENFARATAAFLGANRMICIPSCSELAPPKGFIAGVNDPGDYYPSTLSLASLASVGRLAQLSFPAGEVEGVPVGMSLLAANEAALLALLGLLG